MSSLVEGAEEDIVIEIPAKLVRRGQELRMSYPATDAAAPERIDNKLLALIAKAELAHSQLLSEPDLPKPRRDHLTRLARLKFLAPDIVSTVIEGRQPAQLSARFLQRLASLPVGWNDQRQLLGFC